MNEPNRDEILQAAAGANAEALAFLRAFARRAHWVDDLADEGLGHPAFKLAEMEADWLLCLAGNPFFSAHRAQLVPAMVLALNAWADSNAIPKVTLPSEVERNNMLAADVVKGQWHEVVWLVAWLTGGWRKLRQVSSRYRAYDFEAAPSLPPSFCCERCKGTFQGVPTHTRFEGLKPFCSDCAEVITKGGHAREAAIRQNPRNPDLTAEDWREYVATNGTAKEVNGLPR